MIRTILRHSTTLITITLASLLGACSYSGSGPCTTPEKLRAAGIKAGGSAEPASPQLWKKMCGTYSGMSSTVTITDSGTSASYCAMQLTVSGTPEQPIVETASERFDPSAVTYGPVYATERYPNAEYPILAASHANGMLSVCTAGYPVHYLIQGDKINWTYVGSTLRNVTTLKRGTSGFVAARKEVQRHLAAYNSPAAVAQRNAQAAAVAAATAAASADDGSAAMLGMLGFAGGLYGGMSAAGATNAVAGQMALTVLDAGLRAQAELPAYDYGAAQRELQQRQADASELARLTAAAQKKPKDAAIRQQLVTQRDKVKASTAAPATLQPSPEPKQAKADADAQVQLKAKEAAAQAKADAILARLESIQVR